MGPRESGRDSGATADAAAPPRVTGLPQAAQKRAVELLTAPEIDRTDPLPEAAPGFTCE